MKYVFQIVFLMLVASCAPMSYTLSVDKRIPSSNNIDFQGEIPAVITVAPRQGCDSLSLSNVGIGLAQGLESNLGMEQGAVPVYFFYEDEISFQSAASVEFLHSYTGTDFIIVVDSLQVGDFIMEYPSQNVYYDGRYMAQNIISMPYSMEVSLYSQDKQGEELHFLVDQLESWVLISDEKLPKVSAMSKISDRLPESYIRIGEYVADEFFPEWESVNKRIYVYNNASWTQAYYYAYMFEWEKAMEIWLELANSENVRKAGYAAHNISVSCEILGMDELSKSWSEKSKKLLNY